MANLNDITRNFVRSCLLKEDVEEYSSFDLLLEQDLLEKGRMSAQIQAILEVMENIRLSSNRDRNRMALAKENMKKVRRHVGRLEERMIVLQEQVTLLEENAIKSKKKEE